MNHDNPSLFTKQLTSNQKALNNLKFGNYFRTALVVAHQEDTTNLCRELEQEGFRVTVIKRNNSE
jgi:hypothetical protein